MSTSACQSDELIAFLRKLRAVRSFSDEPVPEEVVNEILEVGRWSGSAMNLQPWEFVVVRDRLMLEAIAASSAHAGHVAGAKVAIVIALLNLGEFDEQFDEGRVAERLMLAAAAHGVGSCIGWLVPDSAGEHVASMLGIPGDRTVRTVISLGYPDETALARRPSSSEARKPLASVVSYGSYGSRTASE